MEEIFDRIAEGLEQLRTAKPQPDIFGAEMHGFQLHPRLTEAAVKKLESKHKIQLPADYRAFLTLLGNGGAGPYYGVFKLGEMDDGFEHKKWKEGGGFVGVLAQPFPHTEPWNDLSGEPEEPEMLEDEDEEDEEEEDDEEYEKALEEFEERYWSPDNVNGAIPICHEGCAYRDWLVVTGPEAGHVWHDARADHAGLLPVSLGKKERVTFLEWYLHWLDKALKDLAKSKRPKTKR
jgi:hypothetical protein